MGHTVVGSRLNTRDLVSKLRFSISAAILLLLVSTAMGASPKNVLILHEGSRLMPYQVLMGREMQKELASTARLSIEVFEEYLDNWRLDADLLRSASALEAKYSNMKFDVVVADGAGALQLLIDDTPHFLHGTPVVFVSVPDFNLPPKLPPNVTGVTTHVDYAETVRLAKKLQPQLQHLYYIDSEPLTADVKNRMFKGEFQPLRNQVEITFWEKDDVETLIRKVTGLPPHSAILFDTYFKDANGHTYGPAQISNRVAASANVPVYTLYQTMIGAGPVGGVVVDFESIGRQASRMILALLRGTNVSDFPVERSQNVTMIDWRQFERFRMRSSALPSSAVVLYREPAIWVRYRLYFAIGGLIILFQLILIFKLAIEGKKRKESEESARKLAGRLIHVQEQERRRIAGELHDDVSQRLALVCLQIDTMRGCPPNSPERLVQELSVLYDEADLISSDIHQFSHELHPNILEKLGLISALRRYCSEFSAHRKIAVDMRTSGAEPSTPPEIALTLFRIGQECLMNIAKHSGATCCNVTLNYARDKVTLAIEDKGRGFDPAVLKEKTGLGIESMRERLRSVGGTLHINAAPSGGTKIRAEVRLVRPEANHAPAEFDKASEEPSNVSA